MILEASRAGVDCVKFQKSCLEAKFTAKALARPYASPNSFGPTYGKHKEHLEFSIEQFKELKDYAESCGLVFSASAMDKVGKFTKHRLKLAKNSQMRILLTFSSFQALGCSLAEL